MDTKLLIVITVVYDYFHKHVLIVRILIFSLIFAHRRSTFLDVHSPPVLLSLSLPRNCTEEALCDHGLK